MDNYSPSVTPIVKGDKFWLDQCPKNAIERRDEKHSLYICSWQSNVCIDLYKT